MSKAILNWVKESQSVYATQIDSCQLNCGGRLITIFDCKVVCNWSGTASDGTEVKGTVTIPEVSHEITLDGLSDYVVCLSGPALPALVSHILDPVQLVPYDGVLSRG